MLLSTSASEWLRVARRRCYTHSCLNSCRWHFYIKPVFRSHTPLEQALGFGSGSGESKLRLFLYSTQQLRGTVSVESLLPLLSSLSWRTLRLLASLCSDSDSLSPGGASLQFSSSHNKISASMPHVRPDWTQNSFLLDAYVYLYSE